MSSAASGARLRGRKCQCALAIASVTTDAPQYTDQGEVVPPSRAASDPCRLNGRRLPPSNEKRKCGRGYRGLAQKLEIASRARRTETLIRHESCPNVRHCLSRAC
jgi:hypothetical protein